MTLLCFAVLTVSLFCTWAQAAVQNEALYDTESRLKAALLRGYDKTVPPQASANQSTVVNFQLALIDIESLDIDAGILTTHAWLRSDWRDDRLKWNPADYNGLDSVAIPYNQIWTPDLVPYNLAADSYAYAMDYQVVIITEKNTSTVMFIPHARLQTRCPVDLTFFPFDTQKCIIKIGSWVYSGKTVLLKSVVDIVDINELRSDSVWEIANVSARVNAETYACCEETYYDYQATLELRRHSHLIVHMYVGPAVCIGLMIPVAFLLPAVSSHKLILGGSLLISQVLMFNVLAESLPASHKTAPAISLYLLANVVLLCLSLACSTVVIYCWDKAKQTGCGVPAGVDKIFLGIFGRLLRVKRDDYIEGNVDLPDSNNSTHENMHGQTDDTVAMVKEYTRLVAPAEWRQLSVVFDRLLFLMFLVISILTMAIMVKYTY